MTPTRSEHTAAPPHPTYTAPSPLLVRATLCHIPGAQAPQLHPPLPAEHPLHSFLFSRAVMTSLSVLETLFQDLGGPMWRTATENLNPDCHELVVPH